MKLNELKGLAAMTDNEYADLARNNPTWQEIAASWALEGIQMTYDNEVVAGRMIAGELSLPEAVAQIRQAAQVVFDPSQMAIVETVQ
jgi:hypothetical protein